MAVTGAIMAVGTVVPPWNLFRLSYLHIFRPLGLLRPNVAEEDPAQHRFALGLGAVVTLAGLAALVLGVPVVGWVLSWAVLILAFINLSVNF